MSLDPRNRNEVAGFVSVYKDGKLRSVAITPGTDVEEALEAMTILGVDIDTVVAFRRGTAAGDVAKSRHSERHPTSGNFVTKPPERLPTHFKGWALLGAVHPHLMRQAKEEQASAYGDTAQTAPSVAVQTP